MSRSRVRGNVGVGRIRISQRREESFYIRVHVELRWRSTGVRYARRDRRCGEMLRVIVDGWLAKLFLLQVVVRFEMRGGKNCRRVSKSILIDKERKGAIGMEL